MTNEIETKFFVETLYNIAGYNMYIVGLGSSDW